MQGVTVLNRAATIVPPSCIPPTTPPQCQSGDDECRRARKSQLSTLWTCSAPCRMGTKHADDGKCPRPEGITCSGCSVFSSPRRLFRRHHGLLEVEFGRHL